MGESKMTTNNHNTNTGLGVSVVLTIVFVVLKLTKTIDWSWIWVLAPLWIDCVIGVIATIVAIIIIWGDRDKEYPKIKIFNKKERDKWKF